MANLFDKLMKRATRRRLEALAEDENYRLLKDLSLFSDLSAESTLFLMQRVIEKRYQKNELIFHQDNPGICCFIIKSGSVEIFTDPGNNRKTVYATLEKGEMFGEISVSSDHNRTTSAEAVDGNTILLSLSIFDLQELEKQFPRDSILMYKRFNAAIIKDMLDAMSKVHQLQSEIDRLKNSTPADER